jgi:hypothetical protein
VKYVVSRVMICKNAVFRVEATFNLIDGNQKFGGIFCLIYIVKPCLKAGILEAAYPIVS